MNLKKYIYLLPLLALWACANSEVVDAPQPSTEGDIYLVVDLDAPASRVSYEFANGSGVEASGNIRASWQLGDIIKVYETDLADPSQADDINFTHVYADYDAYAAAFPYPAAPQTDKYYRFQCVGGEGTTQGVFKYLGLATATVVEKDGIRNVNVDIKSNHKIRNWNKFQGLVIFGNPLRNTMMRTQTAKNDLSHLHYGERMYGYMCAHNFQWYFGNNPSSTNAGAERLVMRNVGGCVYRIIIGGLDMDVYGGSTLTLSMPGITDQGGLRGSAMTLTLGNADDYLLGRAPWSKATDQDNAFCAYIVGWPGTLAANQAATITLKEHMSGYTYTWQLTSPTPITFEAGPYYTIDLRDHQYTKTR